MGIRYYAYAFDRDLSDAAIADPYTVIGTDPLADAWGLPPGFTSGVTGFEPRLPARDLLYLDKAWGPLAALTAPAAPGAPIRPAHRMFEGSVTFVNGGMEWTPWVRAILPREVGPIARDLETITDADVDTILSAASATAGPPHGDFEYVTHFLERARIFAATAARERRGFAYFIG